jgi:hypothetical protein
MTTLLWAIAGWAAFSLLVIPFIVRCCRCMARFDPPVEQLAAAAASPAGWMLSDVLRTAGSPSGQPRRPERGSSEPRRGSPPLDSI